MLRAEQLEIVRVAAVFCEVLGRRDQRAARTGTRVVHALPLLQIAELRNHTDNCAWSVELAAILAGRVSELTDQVGVPGTAQFGEVDVLVVQAVQLEVLDQEQQLGRVGPRLADGAGEGDVVEHALEPGAV